MSIGGGLLGHAGELDALHAAERFGHRLQPRAVQGRVDQVQGRFRFGGHPAGQRFFQKTVDDLLWHVPQQTGGAAFRFRHGLGCAVGNLFNAVGNGFRRLLRDLAAVGAVDLVAVVLGGVVAGGDDNARVAAQLPHRKGQHGGGHQPGVDVGGQTVSGQHTRRKIGKFPGTKAGVIADCNAFAVFFPQIVRQPLRSASNGVFVHSIGAHAQHAPQTAGAEGQLRPEGGKQLLLVFQHLRRRFPGLFVKMRIRCPNLRAFLCQHGNSSIILCIFRWKTVEKCFLSKPNTTYPVCQERSVGRRGLSLDRGKAVGIYFDGTN